MTDGVRGDQWLAVTVTVKRSGVRATVHDVFWPVIPRLGDIVNWNGESLWVEAVEHYMVGEDAPSIHVVASHKSFRVGEKSF